MRMFDMLRAMDAYIGNDSGGVAEDAQNAGQPQCVDCGRECPPQGRCAAGCGQWVCDDCYLRHCEDGCKAVAQ